ncbi:MgtC/SapB family protein [Candidatus Gracilibacteria bacterium]|nr:MgtC/SapB family protein [Candidatus Gracilibacteria bacterium]MCF7856805.1 MgtC/SapB family protein [Candidatus Gracilibacteria bacterium]MCF7897083.1 MgtC/SapB family protein [Candidatus Gracilibacteria bacterium]
MNPEFGILVNFVVALGLGALIGMEREVTQLGRKQRQDGIEFSGLRTYSLISLLGFASAYLASSFESWFFGGVLLVVSAFLLVEYWQQSNFFKFFGVTSEFAAIATFLVGATAMISLVIATAFGVAIVVILAMKKWIREFLKKVSELEFIATVKFIIVAFVVLPLLPNQAVDPWGLVNPHNAWLMVVFISAISFVGYVLTKTIGAKKGLGITGLVGGLASSTAVATSMSEQSKKNLKLNSPFTFAVIIASAVMFVRVGFEVFVLNKELLGNLIITLGIMLMVSFGVLGFLWWKSSDKEQRQKSKDLNLNSPFQLSPALKFGIFYIFILVFADLANRYFGESGIYAASAVSGLADVDAITISLSNLAKSGEIVASVAVRGITLAVMVNTLVKLSIVYLFGSKKFFKQAFVAFGVVLLSGVLAILLV